MDDLSIEIKALAIRKQERYGEFRSTHEALGVALEEWNELNDAIKLNSLTRIRHECIDLAAVLVRLAEQCASPSEQFHNRSQK